MTTYLTRRQTHLEGAAADLQAFGQTAAACKAVKMGLEADPQGFCFGTYFCLTFPHRLKTSIAPLATRFPIIPMNSVQNP